MLIHVSLLLLMCGGAAHGQQIRTLNSSIIMQVGGATLTLSSPSQDAGSNPGYSPYTTFNDLNLATSLLQGQVNGVASTVQYANTRTDSVQLSLSSVVGSLSLSFASAASTAAAALTTTSLVSIAVAALSSSQASLASATSFVTSSLSSALTASMQSLAQSTSAADAARGSTLVAQGSTLASNLAAIQSMAQANAVTNQNLAQSISSVAQSLATASSSAIAQNAVTAAANANASLVALSAFLGGQIITLTIATTNSLAAVSTANANAAMMQSSATSTLNTTLSSSIASTSTNLSSAIVSTSVLLSTAVANVANVTVQLSSGLAAALSTTVSLASVDASAAATTLSLSTRIATVNTGVINFNATSLATFASIAAAASTTVQNLASTATVLAQTLSLATAASAAAVTAQSVPFTYYEANVAGINTGNRGTVVTSTISVAQAFCVSRHGVWNPTTSTCSSPLAYSTVALSRTDADTDAAAVNSCPTGFTPGDCATVFHLLNYWRLNPNREVPYGDAWCAGTVDGTLNSDPGRRLMPGYWSSADVNGGAFPPTTGVGRPYMCSAGTAMMIDQCVPNELGCTGRASYYRPHFYCGAQNLARFWMCVSLSTP